MKVSNFDIIDEPDHSVNETLDDVSDNPLLLHTLTYNIKYPPPRTSSPTRAEKIGLCLKQVNNNYDIIALQECFFQIYYETIIENSKTEVSSYKYYSNIVGYPDSFLFKDSGGAVFISKWPIINEWEHVFTEHTIDDGLARQQKGVIAVEIDKNGQHYYLVTTHTSPYEKHRDVREIQLKEMAEFINEKLINPYPVIIMGDLNIVYGSAEEKNIYNTIPNLKYVANSGYYKYSWDPEINNLADDDEQCTLDYLFYLDNVKHKKPLSVKANIIRPVENGSIDLSDHFAIQGIFRFG
ncbi:endonuclease/exonuclease/phosphatase family protein [Xenorhabdus innexi]|uniref:Beta-hemolysin n=1 Tax=Xenorhabdus innexi TaxID=290109 RepID=A0A1N6N078_9GAMM|nr:endonuclease/exonuclease/phosphatase family protein [Xenorhabdus innexi]PHM37729.1 beta-hemolysin [Xenorhabdus innexi]SIP74434.1 putative Sphingomyelin phosphodiesterase [Xenorhabdus innexi]